VLHRLDGHTDIINDLAAITSSSAAPHHPRLISVSTDTARVWDGETGVMLADLGGHRWSVRAVGVWKEHTGGHDRIATASLDGWVKVWDGEALTLLHDLDCNYNHHMLPFRSAEGPHRLLVGPAGEEGLQVVGPRGGPPAARRHQPRQPAAGLPPAPVGRGPLPPGEHDPAV
jgi:WD40 repeat protein